MISLGKVLQSLRKERGLHQLDVANALHISNKTLSAYERDISEPSPPMLRAICDYYDVSADYLLEINKKPDAISLSEEERQVLSYYNRLNSENKEGIRGLMIV